MIDFSESLLCEKPLVFFKTLLDKTNRHCIEWRSVNSDFTKDGEILAHDFWETYLHVGAKSFHVEIRRHFLPDLYDSPRDPIFTEVVVNGQARLFHLCSIPSDRIYELYEAILRQERERREAVEDECDQNE